jgi:hypothetical protein
MQAKIGLLQLFFWLVFWGADQLSSTQVFFTPGEIAIIGYST